MSTVRPRGDGNRPVIVPGMPQVLQSSFVAIGDNTLDVYIEQGVMFAGGNALNVAAQWALMGLPARYIGAVGRDTEAGHVLSGLRASGLHIEDVVTCEGRTGFTVVRLVNQDRQFLVDEFGVSATWSPTSAEVSSLQEASWVHVAGPLVSTELARDLATSRARVSIDLSTNHDVPSLAGIDIAFASNGDARDPSAEALARRILDAGAAEAVVTCGSGGSIAMTSTTSAACDALPIDLIDTCGAGDSFIAVYLRERSIGASPSSALGAATQSASMTCRHLGGFPQTTMTITDEVGARVRESLT